MPTAAAPPLWPDFHPPRWLRNGHVNTIYSYLRRRRLNLPAAERVWLAAEPGVELLLECNWRPHRAPGLLLVHGLEGHGNVGYMRGLAAKAWARGWHALRFNVRGCGASEPRCRTLYHSGLSPDLARAIGWAGVQPQLTRLAACGYSMGGNMLLRYLGQQGTGAGLAAAAAVSPSLDLAASADRLHLGRNRIYERRFLRSLRRRVARKAAEYPELYRLPPLAQVRSIRDFDDRITAPHMGFSGAAEYYFQASAARVAAAIRTPTLVLHAEDDPFIVITPQTRQLLAANPAIHFVLTRHGGHCGFMQPETRNEDAYWAENRVMEYLASVMPA
jgi:predicted alpha/beta-fold hydrolase